MLRSIKSVVRNRIILLLFLVGMLSFFSFGGGSYLSGTREVSALPCHEVDHYYYSDATYSTQVGERWVRCSGVYTWGTVTAYVVSYDGECCACCGYCPEWCWPN